MIVFLYSYLWNPQHAMQQKTDRVVRVKKTIRSTGFQYWLGYNKHLTFGHFQHAHCTSVHAEYRYTEKTIHTKYNLPGYSFINNHKIFVDLFFFFGSLWYKHMIKRTTGMHLSLWSCFQLHTTRQVTERPHKTL